MGSCRRIWGGGGWTGRIGGSVPVSNEPETEEEQKERHRSVCGEKGGDRNC